jgi:hypothetical protein
MDPFIAGMLGGAIGYALIATGAFFGGMTFRIREHYKAKKQGINYRAELARQTKVVDREMAPKPGDVTRNPAGPTYSNPFSARVCMDPKCMDDTPHPPHTNWMPQAR